MKVDIDPSLISVIERIVNNGNKAVIQRQGTGVIVMEEVRTIRARTTIARTDRDARQ